MTLGTIQIYNKKILLAVVFLLLSLFLVLTFFSFDAKAQASSTINFQGKVVNKTTGVNLVAGNPSCVVAGADTCDFRASIYTDSVGGTLLWRETHSNVELGDNTGIFNFQLNSVCGSWDAPVASGDCGGGSGVDWGSDPTLFVEIEFDDDGNGDFVSAETFSRKEINSVPYAYYSDTAGSLDGLDSSGFVQLQPTSAQSATGSSALIWLNEDGVSTPNLLQLQVGGVDYVTIANDGATVFNEAGNASVFRIEGDTDANLLYLNGANNRIGIGDSAPGARLDIDGITDEVQLIIQANATQTNNLTEWQNSSGAVLTRVDATGRIGIGGTILNNDQFSIRSTYNGGGAFISFRNQPSITSGDSTGFFGQYNNPIYSSSGTLSASGLIALYNSANNTGAGTVNEAIGVHTIVNNTGTGTITTAFGLDVNSAVNSGGGTIGTNYGIFIANQTVGSTNFSIVTNAGNAVFNEGGDANTDFRIEGDTDANLFFADASSDRVGIGVLTPEAWLDIKAATTGSAQINLTSSAGVNPSTPVNGDLWWNGTELYFYDGSSSVDLLNTGGASLFADIGTITYLTSLTDDFAIGGSDLTSAFTVDVSANAVNIGDGVTAASLAFGHTGTITGGTTGSLRLQAGGTTEGPSGNSSIFFLDSAGTVRGRFDTAASQLSINTGDGTDGALSLTSSLNMNTTDSTADSDDNGTYADMIAYKVNVQTIQPESLDTVDTPSGLVVGDEVLLINLQGADGDTADVGNYEYLTISGITSNTITFDSPIQNSYGGTVASNQDVVIQRVPQYTTVTLSSSGSITASAWDGLATTPTGAAGYYTGIVAFRATGTVTVGSGTDINVDGLGYDGSAATINGESYDGVVGSAAASGTDGGGSHGSSGGGETPGTRGGGGGGGNGVGSQNAGAGGGGGHAGGGGGGGGGGTTGGTGGDTGIYAGGGGGGGDLAGTGGNAGSAGQTNGIGGTGGAAGLSFLATGTGGSAQGGANDHGGGGAGGGLYGSGSLSQIYYGSGGGGGGTRIDSGADGGAGGGIILISADAISLTGNISADGANGNAATGQGGDGGGGAGGSIKLEISDSVTLGSSLVTASGGTSTDGGDGGVGRIRIDLSGTSTGTTSPSAYIVESTSNYGTFYLGAINTSAADVAEHYPSLQNLSKGEVVEFDPNNNLHIRRTTTENSEKIIGVVSTEPGVILGQGDNPDWGDKTYPVVLAGRAPVFIDPTSEPIAIGDYLTSSNAPGMATKAGPVGTVVGRALESWTPESDQVQIMVFISPELQGSSTQQVTETENSITSEGGISYLTNSTDDFAIGGSSLTSVFSFDVSENVFTIGDGLVGDKSPALVFRASNASDSGYLSFSDNDNFFFGGGGVGIGVDNSSALLSIAASTLDRAQINLAAGVDPTNPNSGDLWFNGTKLYFNDGQSNKDLIGSYILIREEQPAGTNGGTFVAGEWVTRTLNTEVNDDSELAVIDPTTNQITLKPGSYRYKVLAPAGNVGNHRLRLYDITNDAVVQMGAIQSPNNTAELVGELTVTEETIFEIQHRSFDGEADTGFGIASGWGTEIYTVLEIESK